MALDGVLPGFKHFLVGLFFMSYAFLIVDLGELSGPFVVHLRLQLSANLTVALTHLPKNVGLVLLPGHSVSHGLCSERSVLSFNFALQICLLV